MGGQVGTGAGSSVACCLGTECKSEAVYFSAAQERIVVGQGSTFPQGKEGVNGVGRRAKSLSRLVFALPGM